MEGIFINPLEIVKCEFKYINKLKKEFYDNILLSDFEIIKTYLEDNTVTLPYINEPITYKNLSLKIIDNNNDEIIDLLNNKYYSPLIKLSDILIYINNENNNINDNDNDNYLNALQNIMFETECLQSLNNKNNNINLTEYLSDNESQDKEIIIYNNTINHQLFN